MIEISNDRILVSHIGVNEGSICHISKVCLYLRDNFGFSLVNGTMLHKYRFTGEIRAIAFSYDGISFQQDRFIELLERFPDAKVYYITTEYLLEPHNRKRMYFRENNRCRVICNFEKFKRKFTELEHHMVNWNVLVHKGYNRDVRFGRKTLIYWGRYRNDRAVYYREYLNHRGVYISTMGKNVGLFQLDCPDALYCKALDSDYNWEYFNYSIYIEDIGTHDNYNHMASRFYEAIDRGIVMFIDINCRNSIERSMFSGLDFDGLYVDSYEALMDRLDNIDECYVRDLYQSIYGIIEEEKVLLHRDLVNIFNIDRRLL